MVLDVSKNPYRARYFRLLDVIENFRDEERISIEQINRYLKEYLESRNYKVT